VAINAPRAQTRNNALNLPNVSRLESLPPAYFFAPDLEREINRLEHVTSAKVLSTGTEIDEIHVLAPRDRSPKKIVRDIESLLLVRFGLRIDHRCISVVHVDGAQTAPTQTQRPRIVEVGREGTRIKACLAVGDKVLVGHAQPAKGVDELEATSRAVVHAVEQLLQTPGVLMVLQTQVAALGEHQLVIVLVRWLFADQHELLVGASLVNDDPMDAAGRATLDALNRRIVRFQAEAG
jgi:hypothetical protein